MEDRVRLARGASQGWHRPLHCRRSPARLAVLLVTANSRSDALRCGLPPVLRELDSGTTRGAFLPLTCVGRREGEGLQRGDAHRWAIGQRFM
ncbi:unspecified product [Leishmania tarentolae]|uniref:Unspecified product n=1 Tax=Leishmania tarentolae TaxID=5689 RepID=A0A640KEG8_LEITA|nr:unspecified product [Leishmania tarentolae]